MERLCVNGFISSGSQLATVTCSLPSMFIKSRRLTQLKSVSERIARLNQSLYQLVLQALLRQWMSSLMLHLKQLWRGRQPLKHLHRNLNSSMEGRINANERKMHLPTGLVLPGRSCHPRWRWFSARLRRVEFLWHLMGLKMRKSTSLDWRRTTVGEWWW